MGTTRQYAPSLLLLALVAASPLTGVLPWAAGASGAFFDHIVVIVMENHNLRDIDGSSAPYMTSMANTWGLAQRYTAISHPSEGNYIAMIGGDNFGHTGDGFCCYGITEQNIIDRLETAGLTWQAFAENATGSGTCSFDPPRHADHFPFLTFSGMNTSGRCSNFLTATSSSDPEVISSLNSASPPNFLWLTPNDCNNMHNDDCGGGAVQYGDNYLKDLVPAILASTTFTSKRAALFITFDEGGVDYPDDFVYTVWAGPVARRDFQSPTLYSHYSFLKTLENNWGLQQLTNNDGQALSMSEFFGVQAGFPWLWLGVGLAIGLGLAIAVVGLRKRSRRRLSEAQMKGSSS